jgi:outer membrane protein TolC
MNDRTDQQTILSALQEVENAPAALCKALGGGSENDPPDSLKKS